ncbi:unnamed protein product [Tilletia controversa]|uniref:Alpha/beta hydrolase fold-3 domain-containing protein n=3 Tax=Tilletia TaxID=13289 RepID=A0A8X7SXS5_9BASI|nr:hypothetical protein CF328_g7190 [Tilletia controversa]KAE8187785.1 hypothetical protein CF335_g7073 [Tilletia laevis]KAE8248316.1 hypothetical protein A4X03_0g6814 [Tilletia caries]KAE8196369.1 hypothetical protein CF336_g2650 [Tilletia laevis]KAE8249679.1 hypothetical protein A4X06_0g3119 [Tilletia controversa]
MSGLPHHPHSVKTEFVLNLPAHLLRGVNRLVENHLLPRSDLPDGVVVNRIEVPSRPRRKVAAPESLPETEESSTTAELAPRYILVDVYELHDAKAEEARSDHPVPVHISLHGSGFITPNLGQDRDFTSWLAAQHAFASEGGVVFDTDYRKAPEHPFPAGLEDIEDVIRYIHSKPDVYDRTRISIGGFSAGATLAISASYTVATGKAFATATAADADVPNAEKPSPSLRIPISSVSSAYPATDMRPDGERETAREPLMKVDPSGNGAALPKGLTDWFTKAYLVHPETEAFDKRVSVTLIDQSDLPRHLLVATGEADSLFPEAKQFVEKMKEQGHPNACFLTLGGEGHGFDKHPSTLMARLHTDALNMKVLENILAGWKDAAATAAAASATAAAAASAAADSANAASAAEDSSKKAGRKWWKFSS